MPERPAVDFTDLGKDGTLHINNVMHRDPVPQADSISSEADRRLKEATAQKEHRREDREAAELSLRQQKNLDAIWAARDAKRELVMECLARHTAKKEGISTEDAMKAILGSTTIRIKLEDGAFLEKAAALAAQNKPAALAKEIATKKIEKRIDQTRAIGIMGM